MAEKLKVILFEDRADFRKRVIEALQVEFGDAGTVIPFESTDNGEEGTFEKRLEARLQSEPYSSAELIVADKDLSLSEGFRGLSVNSVSAAARRLAIPVCAYARAFTENEDDFTWRGRWEEGLIVLSIGDPLDNFAKKTRVVAQGFEYIGNQLPDLLKAGDNSPAGLLSTLLGKPEYENKMALYAVGDQNRLTSLPPRGQQADNLNQKMTHFLGYWLFNSLLKFPGVFTNEIASASYLNIDVNDFQREDVKALFVDALYSGPFSDPQEPVWWRGALDDVVSAAGFGDGLELVNDQLKDKVQRSKCYVDETKTAGYYCIIARKPVSLENSKGNLSWFPRGADLTRVSKTKFEEYEPWLGS